MLGIVNPQTRRLELQKIADRAKFLYESYKKLAPLYLSTFGKDVYAKSTIENDLEQFGPFRTIFNPSSPYFYDKDIGWNTNDLLRDILIDLEIRYMEYRMHLFNKGADISNLPSLYAVESGTVTFKRKHWPWVLGAGAILIGFMIFRKKR